MSKSKYYSNDQVCRFSCRELAAKYGMGIEALSYNDPPPNGQCERVLYDFDTIPDDQRSTWMNRLAHEPQAQIVAVHSYNLSDDERQALQNNLVTVYRRLDDQTFANSFVGVATVNATVSQHVEK